MESEATCCVCLDLFVKPVILPCGHNFCTQCVSGLVELNDDDYPSDEEESNYSFKCPQCRHYVDLGCKGVEGLPLNKPLNNISQILKENDRKLARSISWKDVCKKHKVEEESYFCQSCKCTVCPLCVTTDHSGFGHVVKDLEQYVTEEKEKLEASMEDLKRIKAEITMKRSYLQEIIKEAKSCEKDCHDRAAANIKKLVTQLELKKDAFNTHVSSKCRELCGPIETMITIYNKLESEAIALENQHNVLNFGDPMRRIKNYQNLGLHLTSFLTFSIRSIPALPPPPEKLPQMMLGHLDEVFVAINKVQPLKTTRDSMTQTDFHWEANKENKPFQESKQLSKEVATQSPSDPTKSNNNEVQSLQETFSTFNPFTSSAAPFGGGSEWRQTVFQVVNDFTSNGPSHQLQEPNSLEAASSSGNQSREPTGKGITLQRFTEKLCKGTSFHESLPSSPTFVFGGKRNDAIFVFGAKDDSLKSYNDLVKSQVSSTSDSSKQNKEGIMHLTSSAIASNPSLLDKDQKSSSTPNLLFSSSSSQPNQNSSLWDEKQWQLPKPKYDTKHKLPRPWVSKSRSPRRHQKKFNHAEAGPSTSHFLHSATGFNRLARMQNKPKCFDDGYDGARSADQLSLGSDSDSPPPNEDNDSYESYDHRQKKKRMFPFKKSIDYSDESSGNGSSSDKDSETSGQLKRAADFEEGNSEVTSEDGHENDKDDDTRSEEPEPFSFNSGNSLFSIGRKIISGQRR